MDEKLEYLVRAGIYSNKSEAVRDAIRRLLESLDMRDIALKAYKYGNASFQLALEIASVPYEELAAYFARHGVVPELGSDDIEEVSSGKGYFVKGKMIVVDPLTLEVLVKSRVIDILILNELLEDYPLAVVDSARTTLRSLSLKRLLVGAESIERYINVLRKQPGAAMLSRKNNITTVEAECMLAASINKGVYMTVDMRTRQVARLMSVPATPLLSLVYTLYSLGYMNKTKYLEILGLLETNMLIVPREAKRL